MAQEAQYENELKFIREKSMNEFNDKEGFNFAKEKEDFEELLETYLLTLDIRAEKLGGGVNAIVTNQPFIPSPDNSRIRELIDVLKSNKKPEKPVIEYIDPDPNGRSLNMNS
jgi:hypothetical protein